MAKTSEAIKEEVIEIEETLVKNTKSYLNAARENSRKLFLAGLGAVMWANDEVSEFVGGLRGKTEELEDQVEEQVEEVVDSAETLTSKMIDRGSSVEADTRKRIEDVVENGRAQLNKRTDAVLSKFDGTVENLLGRINLPTKDSIDQLNKKINSLGRKIDQMRKQQESVAA